VSLTSTVAGSGAPGDPLLLAGGVNVIWTSRLEGDLGTRAGGDVELRRRAVLDATWDWVDQVHGDHVALVRTPGSVAGPPADAMVCADPRAALAVFTADCAPIALSSPEGAFGAVHAGWRGLEAGVIEQAVAALRQLGASRVVAALGPCIGPECYEFGQAELDRLVARFGPAVASRTATGELALDVAAAVRVAVGQCQAELVFDSKVCTGCSPELFSYRARADAGRQAMVVMGSQIACRGR
jgi:YfiH family protein